jgi:DNA polymerase elongation subunit (family B)
VYKTYTAFKMEHTFRLFDFNFYNHKVEQNNENDSDHSGKDDSSSEGGFHKNETMSQFMIQMFGINEQGESCSILVDNFKPFFYIKVSNEWTIRDKENFLNKIKKDIGEYFAKDIVDCKLIKRKKLYGFDGGSEHKFIVFRFENTTAFNKVKNLWFHNGKLKEFGYMYKKTETRIYESNIPPILRFFHIKNISPSGWVALPKKRTRVIDVSKKTTCKYEFEIDQKHIIALSEKEERVPYKICSFDIEASSSHGDFPVPKKSYKKLATNIVEYLEKHTELTTDTCRGYLRDIILTAFGYPQRQDNEYISIDLVYPKKKNKPTGEQQVCAWIDKWLSMSLEDISTSESPEFSIETMFQNMGSRDGGEGHGDCEDDNTYNQTNSYKKANSLSTGTGTGCTNIAEVLCNKKMKREERLEQLNNSLSDTDVSPFPELEGDIVTFIGSTFMKYGDKDPYMSHCAVLNTCDVPQGENIQIDTYKNEREVLLAWTELIQKENPDIIIGYNIFGFDYTFMFQRAEENDCVEAFLKLSRNNDEVCGSVLRFKVGDRIVYKSNKEGKTGKVISCNRDFTFDILVKGGTEITSVPERDIKLVHDTNKRYKLEESAIVLASGQHELKYIKMNGRIQIDLYNHFRREETLTSYKLDYVASHFIGDYVTSIDTTDNHTTSVIHSKNLTGLLVGSYVHFEEIGHSTDYYEGGNKFNVVEINKEDKTFTIDACISPDMTKKVRWGLAKDDVTPKDIFTMANGSSKDRSVIAKYCIQDCNLVHYLMNKADILTGMIEMSKICSVPISFLVLRGQGIKLTSYVAKKCREKGTLMPVIEKSSSEDGYEGAIVLPPKCDLYMDNPVACVDYASLYPSSMLSENLSHDSKVWTKEYDLNDVLLTETGETDDDGTFIYDNLPDYEYVDVTYDTFRYVRKSPSAAAEKVRSGKKTCRFAQFPQGTRAVMPSILEELLKARKSTRKLIPQQNDQFMKNVLDKRQLAYKLTANSLYGQCGAKTSTFYEKDVAASTTATGRLLLTYAKRMIEETYGNRICETSKYGQVCTKAEYIYGDTDSVFFTFNLETLEGEPIRGKKALEITIELAQEAGQLASSFLKGPHDLEYEKTFMPFCLLSKKRYVGMLYEMDPNKGERKEMGIVLKRRDNAPIVKDIYGGIIDILMKQQDIKKAIEFLSSCLQDIVDEKYPMDKLIITRSLKSGYKNPKQIAHKVLADRITARDPGNKPGAGDRIPFVYIHTPNKKALQGEKIELPSYIIENNLKVDYSFYITNQIMKPVQQVFALVLEKIWNMQNKRSKLLKFKTETDKLRKETLPEKFDDKLESLKNKEIQILLFDKFLRVTNNQKQGNSVLTSFFTKK